MEKKCTFLHRGIKVEKKRKKIFGEGKYILLRRGIKAEKDKEDRY